MRKPWSIHKRNGIYQSQMYDYNSKQYQTAKSTHTRDRNEAELIAYRRAMEFDSGLAVEYTKWAKTAPTLTASILNNCSFNSEMSALVQAACQDAFDKVLQNIPYNKQARPFPWVPDYEDTPEEIKPLLDRLSTLTFYDYILLYWNYDESPFIKGKIRTSEPLPNPERFRNNTGIAKKYAAYIPHCLLTEITGTKIDTMLGAIRTAGKLKEQTMKNMRYIFIQPLHFAYRNNLLARDIAQQVTTASKASRKKAKKEAEKAIFTKEDAQRLFNSSVNPFDSETYRLINEILFKTGCRIGELQALQIQDFIKTSEGYALKISKNYCRSGKRLKCTKTERVDIVPISSNLAAKLIAHLEKHLFKDNQEAFIFSSAKDAYTPICYENINKDFNKTMTALGIKKQNLTLHSYRHTFATFLRMAGYSEEQLRYLTRHDSIAEVHRYTDHYTPDMERLKYQAAIDIEKIVV